MLHKPPEVLRSIHLFPRLAGVSSGAFPVLIQSLEMFYLFVFSHDVILQSGSLGMMALESVVLENKHVPSFIADLRCSLNSLTLVLRIQSCFFTG